MESQNAIGYFRVLELPGECGQLLARRYLHPQASTYHVQMEAVTAFVLAGGKSSRMGRDKALLKLGDRTLLRRAMALAGAVAREVRIVGDPMKYAEFGHVVSDVYPNRGPLGGIHAALADTNTDLNLVLATDLPFVAAGFLQFLLRIAQATDALITVPKVDGYFEPLCAIYRKRFGENAEAALKQGKNKVDALFSSKITRTVTREEILQAGFNPTMFRNLNTPDHLAQAENEFSP